MDPLSLLADELETPIRKGDRAPAGLLPVAPSGLVVVRDDAGDAIAVQAPGGAGRGPIRVGLQGRILWADNNLSQESAGRLSGMHYGHKVIGWVAPQPLRRRLAPSAAALAVENPPLHGALCAMADEAWQLLRTHAPAGAAATADAAADVPACWRLGETPWTSGIVNLTAQLPYHRDSGNIAGTWSAMMVLRKGYRGGHLSVPQLGYALPCDDNTWTMFDGARALHGVTPLEARRPDAYRYSIVFYTKSKFRGMAPFDAAVAEARRLATTRAEAHP